MHTHVKIVNRTPGPLTIMNTWGKQVEMIRARTVWKKGDEGLVKSFVKDVRQVPTSFCLMPKEEATLPRAAANADQIVGLHRAGMISVSPVTVEDAPQAPAEEEGAKDTSPAPKATEEAREGSQDASKGDGKDTGKKGRGKGTGKAKAKD